MICFSYLIIVNRKSEYLSRGLKSYIIFLAFKFTGENKIKFTTSFRYKCNFEYYFFFWLDHTFRRFKKNRIVVILDLVPFKSGWKVAVINQFDWISCSISFIKFIFIIGIELSQIRRIDS